MALLQDKVGLVTGGGSGIGRATAQRLAQEGASVAVLDLNLANAEAVAEQIRERGGIAHAFGCDVSNKSATLAAIAEAAERFGPIDVAVNCAGIGGGGAAFADLSDDIWDRNLGVNLSGVRNSMLGEIRQMRGRGGSIVNISSGAGLEGVAWLSAYVASKHGVVGLTKSAALDHAADGIRINAICPGVIATPMTQGALDAGMLDPAALSPMKRPGRPEEVAAAAAWLCSDEASYVTGIAMPVDGGHLAQ